jgi:hypothetical protein
MTREALWQPVLRVKEKSGIAQKYEHWLTYEVLWQPVLHINDKCLYCTNCFWPPVTTGG